MCPVLILNNYRSAGATSAMYVYAGEMMSNATRSKYMSYIGYSLTIANFLLAGIGYTLHNYGTNIYISEHYSIQTWRQQMIVLCIPGLLGAILFHWLPESPKFLVSKGRTDEALQVLKFIHKINNHGKGAFPIKELKMDGHQDSTEKSL